MTNYKTTITGIEKVYHGVDWLTLTGTANEDGTCNILEFWDYMSGIWDAARNSSKVRWAGYSGLAIRNASLRFGTRVRSGKVDYIISCGGDSSRVVFSLLREFGKEVNCTRIDLQITLKLFPEDPSLASRHYSCIRASQSMGKSITGRREPVLISSPGGQTLYVGNRKSRGAYYRFYDKSFDLMDLPGSQWRMEIEYKRDISNEILGRLLKHGEYILPGMVKSAFVSDVGIVAEVKMASVTGFLSKATDKDAQGLIWLETSVKPFITKLMSCVGDRDVLRALGLERYMNVSRETSEANSGD